ncbi:MAG: hypothetical protein VB876_09880 [Pirellulales bacterium]
MREQHIKTNRKRQAAGTFRGRERLKIGQLENRQLPAADAFYAIEAFALPGVTPQPPADTNGFYTLEAFTLPGSANTQGGRLNLRLRPPHPKLQAV